MKVTLAKSAGFCFGVRRAIDIALKTAASGKKVYMLGDIVHNEEVVGEIKNAGIKKIISLGKGKNKTLIIRAHGACGTMLRKAKRLGYEIVDATCPMVKEIHSIVRAMEAKGYRIIVIGDKKHDEVQGIIGQLKQRALVIEDSSHIPLSKVKAIRKACIVSQSTQNVEHVLKIVSVLQQYIKEVKFYNTICKPTRIKQDEMKVMPLENDCMIIIGSKSSANTKRLYELSKRLNRKSYWVSSKKALHLEWFEGAGRVGVTAGASTPVKTIQEVVHFLSLHGR